MRSIPEVVLVGPVSVVEGVADNHTHKVETNNERVEREDDDERPYLPALVPPSMRQVLAELDHRRPEQCPRDGRIDEEESGRPHDGLRDTGGHDRPSDRAQAADVTARRRPAAREQPTRRGCLQVCVGTSPTELGVQV